MTERDLRRPEFADCEPDDLEWRDDGVLARKDRWERGIRKIAGIFNICTGFEVDEIVERVRALAHGQRSTVPPGYPAPTKGESLCSKGRNCGICATHDMWYGKSPDGECAWSRRTEAGVIAVAWAHFEGRDWTEVDV